MEKTSIKNARQQIPYKLAVNMTELSEMMSISRPLAYQLVKRPDFPPPFYVCSKKLYSVDDIRDWIKKQTGAE